MHRFLSIEHLVWNEGFELVVDPCIADPDPGFKSHVELCVACLGPGFNTHLLQTR